MLRTGLCIALALTATVALADAPKPTLPKVGDALGLSDWPKLQWLYDAPAEKDAAGKVVVHWFCTPKIAACTDDLARVIALRDGGRAYIIAYIDGTQSQAKKLDPIRESEGVGRGTVAYEGAVGKLMKAMSVAPGPTSIVVGTDSKVALVTIGGDVASLDARDQKVAALVGAIKDYSASYDGPTKVKPNEKFQLVARVQLATWLSYAVRTTNSFALTAPSDLKCDAKKLAPDQLRIEGHTVTATVTCSAPKGNYEAQGRISFGYVDASNNAGVVEDGTTWKFTVAP
jgi:hypothetical protein